MNRNAILARFHVVLVCGLCLMAGSAIAKPAQGPNLRSQVERALSEGRFLEAIVAIERERERLKASDADMKPWQALRLGDAYLAIGRTDRAETEYLTAVELHEESKAPGESGWDAALRALASMLEAQDRYPEAEIYRRRNVARLEEHIGPMDRRLIGPLLNLAENYRATGKPEAAERAYQHALAIEHGLPVPDGGLKPEILGALALLQRNQGRFDQARRYYELQIDLLRQTRGEQNHQLALALENYASLLEDMSRESGVEQLPVPRTTD